MSLRRTAVVITALSLSATSAFACQNSGSFANWKAGFTKQILAAGISRHTVQNVFSKAQYDKKVIAFDRKQNIFSLDFISFSSRLISKNRLVNGRKKLKQHARTIKMQKKHYGVPGPVIAAFWGLETDFGGNTGNFNTINALATLSYDCRRPEKFSPELIAALKLIDQGDLSAHEMKGAWAGEVGQTQFLPTYYDQYAVDGDGDGHRNLLKSVPDVFASTGNYLHSFGWRAGEPWLQEVQVPQNLPWDQADLAIRLPVTQWAKWGVKRANGKSLKSGLKAALILPIGRHGPAFLAYHNFDLFTKWNESLTYSLTAAYFATRLAGAPAMNRGNGKTNGLNHKQTVQLQIALKKRGYHVGKVDGIIGANTRAAVKDIQMKLGLPADSYPTTGLLKKLR